MKRKGFTLIELLAVIVILAVIALIATSIIMNVISDARMGAFKDSAYGVIKAAEIKVAKNQNTTNTYTGETFDLTGSSLEYKGTKPKAGVLVVKSGGTMALEMNDGEFCATKDYTSSDIIVTKKGSKACDGTGIDSNFHDVISAPEIKEGMIPVIFDNNGNTVKADTNSKWYDYENKKWANAVSVTSAGRSNYQNASAGTVINEADILGYFVWIPRYRYQLWNAENGTSNEQEIKIEFEKVGTAKSNGTKNGQWLTHPAFTFGNSELTGIWVGKFEMTGTADMPTTKPNSMSLTNFNNKAMFDIIRKFSTTNTYGLTSYDAHMMKNSEWGAVAYLSHSKYGKNDEIWINNVNTGTGSADSGVKWGPSITGCAGTSVSANVKNNMTACEPGRDYKNAGVNASTTGNITGIYDMSGGALEHIMDVLVDSNGEPFYGSFSGFNASNMPDKKYYSVTTLTSSGADYAKEHLGYAVTETIKKPVGTQMSWYYDSSSVPGELSAWTYRGGSASRGSAAGAFSVVHGGGEAEANDGSRAVIVAD